MSVPLDRSRTSSRSWNLTALSVGTKSTESALSRRAPTGLRPTLRTLPSWKSEPLMHAILGSTQEKSAGDKGKYRRSDPMQFWGDKEVPQNQFPEKEQVGSPLVGDAKHTILVLMGAG